jgi:hypothetical protein
MTGSATKIGQPEQHAHFIFINVYLYQILVFLAHTLLPAESKTIDMKLFGG